jgi:hypothetical protein
LFEIIFSFNNWILNRTQSLKILQKQIRDKSL